jgi:hypothetical protein
VTRSHMLQHASEYNFHWIWYTIFAPVKALSVIILHSSPSINSSIICQFHRDKMLSCLATHIDNLNSTYKVASIVKWPEELLKFKLF